MNDSFNDKKKIIMYVCLGMICVFSLIIFIALNRNTKNNPVKFNNQDYERAQRDKMEKEQDKKQLEDGY